MLKKHSELFLTLLIVFDVAVVTGSWVASYQLRFHNPWVTEWLPVTKGVPDFEAYAKLLFVIVPTYWLAFRARGLYLPQRISHRFRELAGIFEASMVGFLLVIAAQFFLRDVHEYSRGVLAIFAPLQALGTVLSRLGIRQALREARKRGYNLRHVVVVGAGALGAEVVERIRRHPEMGLNVVGVLAKDERKVGGEVRGVPVTGVYEDITRIVEGGGIDQVIMALPSEAHDRLESLLEALGPLLVDIKVVPDLYRFISLRSSIEDFDGIPIVNLLESPLYGWNRVLKRAFDVSTSTALLILSSPLLLLLALGVKRSSSGPVFYRQERMGLDGRIFRMYKFRTMRDDAEAATGPVWASADDPRRTWFGSWMRTWSLDELPQLFNVLRGDMSLVGPRPERPVFINEFKDRIPRYMLRHRIHAGMTGWAQVNGLRGNTSLEQRIDFDLYYIENWSLGFDLRILAQTVVNLRSKHAY